ncbi:COG1470 family protein [Candidatus Bipolaricaulota sp. J31]
MLPAMTVCGSTGELYLEPTASAALPGKPFLVVMRILSPVDIPGFSLTVELPPGWDMRIRGPCLEELPCPLPVYAGRPAEMELVLDVPADAAGTYEISFHIPALSLRETLAVEVRGCLDPREVVRHWDVAAGSIDLSRRGGVTYERLLWAIAHMGREVPFACRSLTRADLDDLVSEWVGTG